MTAESRNLHATTVAVGDRGLLIMGPSGSGKSALALQLIAMGAELVSDDRTDVTRSADRLIASAPPPLEGLIEARHVGILELPSHGPTPLALVVDLDQIETQRLPARHTAEILGISLPCLHNCDSRHFPAAVLLYLSGNRKESP